MNLASRIEGLTKQLGVATLVSESTWGKLQGAFATRRLCRVRVVGIASPLDVFELHSASADDSQWSSRRDAYESALHQFETGLWAEACRTLYPLVADQPNHYDVPSLTLIGRAVECLKSGRRNSTRCSISCTNSAMQKCALSLQLANVHVLEVQVVAVVL